jgi:hypothetical protein
MLLRRQNHPIFCAVMRLRQMMYIDVGAGTLDDGGVPGKRVAEPVNSGQRLIPSSCAGARRW